jgi:hypothetical protein
MYTSQPVSELIKVRYSSRKYLDRPIAEDARRQFTDSLAALDCGPLGTPARFVLIAATAQERDALRGIGTYGMIRGAQGFIVGVVTHDTQLAARDLEDFGYLMERAVLMATDLGLGTCWLGGNFTRSSFGKKIAIQAHEVLPAVTATGYSASPNAADPIRRLAGSTTRLPWESLFFEQRFGNPLPRDAAGAYGPVLEGVRLGPSASNKQPWRIIKEDRAWHFYMQRTKGYRENLGARLLRVVDLQRVDMGIAMGHFELAAAEHGLRGRWILAEPALAKPDGLTEYTVTWREQ